MPLVGQRFARDWLVDRMFLQGVQTTLPPLISSRSPTMQATGKTREGRSLPLLNSALLLLNVTFALIWYHRVRSMTSSPPDYIQMVVAWLVSITGLITWLSGIAWGIQYVVNRLRQRPQPKKLTREQMMQKYLPFAVDKVFRPLLHSIAAVITLVVFAGVLGYLAFYVGPAFLPPGGRIIVTPTAPAVPYTRHQKYVYVAVKGTKDQAGGIAVFDERALEVKGRFITLGSRFNDAAPTCIAVAPSKRKLFVTDNAAGLLYVVDEMWDLHTVAVGLSPVCVAVSPDERKAYVTNEQPAPYGTISVIDIDKEVVSHTISGVNCPKDLALSRDGKRIYVTTECGGGHDPLLVVETDTDRVIATIPDVEIGRAPAVSPDGKRLFVARLSQDRSAPKRFLLTVFSTVDHKILNETSFDEEIEAIAVSPDGKYLFVGTGPSVRILSTENVQIQKSEIQTCAVAVRQTATDCWPGAIAMSDNGALYVLRRNGELQFSGLQGLSNP